MVSKFKPLACTALLFAGMVVNPHESQAGVIPWLYDAIFGPPGSMMAYSGGGYYGGGGAYTAGYAPYWSGYAPAFGYGGCGPCQTTSYAPAGCCDPCQSSCSPCGGGCAVGSPCSGGACLGGACGMAPLPASGRPTPTPDPGYTNDQPVPPRRPSGRTFGGSRENRVDEEMPDAPTFRPPVRTPDRTPTREEAEDDFSRGNPDRPGPTAPPTSRDGVDATEPLGTGSDPGAADPSVPGSSRPGSSKKKPFNANKPELGPPTDANGNVIPEKKPAEAAPVEGDVTPTPDLQVPTDLEGKSTHRPVIHRERLAIRQQIPAPRLVRTNIRPTRDWSAAPTDGKIARQ